MLSHSLADNGSESNLTPFAFSLSLSFDEHFCSATNSFNRKLFSRHFARTLSFLRKREPWVISRTIDLFGPPSFWGNYFLVVVVLSLQISTRAPPALAAQFSRYCRRHFHSLSLSLALIPRGLFPLDQFRASLFSMAKMKNCSQYFYCSGQSSLQSSLVIFRRLRQPPPSFVIPLVLTPFTPSLDPGLIYHRSALLRSQCEQTSGRVTTPPCATFSQTQRDRTLH